MQQNIRLPWRDWNVVRHIGSGSFGSVYEIQRDVFGRIEKAALKIITIPKSNSDIEDLYNDGFDSASVTQRYRSYLEDIANEYSLMAEMKGHTNVVYCDDFQYIQHDDGIGWDIYIKMELLTPLAKTIHDPITEEQVIRVGVDLCNALELCRRHNIVHRDIKPQNIFVSQDLNYKLGDFGIAKTAERTTSGTMIGTYKYMAPEVYHNQPYGSAADIYSLGLVLYWMLNERRTPFLPLPPQMPTARQEDEARRRRFMGEQIPAPKFGSEALHKIVLKACAYDPADRFADAAQMRQALEQLRLGAAVDLPSPEPVAPPVIPEEVEEPVVSEQEETVPAVDKPNDVSSYDEDVTVGIYGTQPPIRQLPTDDTVDEADDETDNEMDDETAVDELEDDATVGLYWNSEATEDQDKSTNSDEEEPDQKTEEDDGEETRKKILAIFAVLLIILFIYLYTGGN